VGTRAAGVGPAYPRVGGVGVRPALPRDLRYTPDHLWVRVEGDHATVGLAPFVIGETGPVASFTLPLAGIALAAEAPFARVVGSRGGVDLPSPLGGEVVEVNDDLLADPSLAEEDPFAEGWLVRLALDDPSQAEGLLSAERYRDYLSGLQGGDEEAGEAR
jgi:glycine cleavage system H protein